MNITKLNISGCYLLESKKFQDQRGSFVKTYHADMFHDAGINFNFAEEFYSTSHKDVIRGMHFQIPPADHDKFVFCAKGAVIDVFLDIRKTSETYGKYISVELTGDNAKALYLPKGVAHGFLSLQNDSLMIYKTSSVHTPVCDSGIKWNSFGFEWPVTEPIISERDSKFIELNNFDSPFK